MKVKGKMGIVLAVVAGAGMIFTVWLTAKKAPEAVKLKEAALEKKRIDTGDENAQLTKLEALRAQIPCYGPVIASAAVATGSMIASQIIPQEALYDVKKTFQTYKDVTAKLNGPEAEKVIDQITEKKLEQGSNGIKKEIFVIEFLDEQIEIETTIVDILEAEYNINRFFKGCGRITFNEALEFFHEKARERGEEFGWDEYIGDAFYGYCWIDFQHRRGMLNGKPVNFIDMPFPCHPLNEDE